MVKRGLHFGISRTQSRGLLALPLFRFLRATIRVSKMGEISNDLTWAAAHRHKYSPVSRIQSRGLFGEKGLDRPPSTHSDDRISP